MKKRSTVVSDALKGIALIAMLWVANVGIAFGIFEPIDEHTTIINITWLVADIAVCLLLWKLNYLTGRVMVFAILTILSLAALYMTPINRAIPDDARELNRRLSDTPDRYEYAKNLFYEVEKRWSSPIRQYLLEPHKVFFIKDFGYFWNTKGYVDSSVQAQIYRRLLLESGRFNDDEVVLKQKWCVNSPHGVIVIKHPERDIYADLWAVDAFPRERIPETYSFGQYTARPCNTLSGSPF